MRSSVSACAHLSQPHEEALEVEVVVGIVVFSELLLREARVARERLDQSLRRQISDDTHTRATRRACLSTVFQ
jgi:hypothetical protein